MLTSFLTGAVVGAMIFAAGMLSERVFKKARFNQDEFQKTYLTQMQHRVDKSFEKRPESFH